MSIELNLKERVEIFDKNLILIGQSEDTDFVIKENNLENEHLRIRFVKSSNDWIIENLAGGNGIYLDNKPLSGSLILNKNSKITFSKSSDILRLRILDDQSSINTNTITNFVSTQSENNNGKNKVSDLETRHKQLNQRRLNIVSRLWSKINVLRQKISSNNLKIIALVTVSFIISIIFAFGCSNLILGLYPEHSQSGQMTNIPFNLNGWIAATIIIFGLSLLLEEGIYRTFVSAKTKSKDKLYYIMGSIMGCFSAILISIVFTANLVYFFQIEKSSWTFPIILCISLILLIYTSSIVAGFLHYELFKFNDEISELENDINFGNLIQDYRDWINASIAAINERQIEGLKKRLFYNNLVKNLKILLAMLTAPFVSFGAANTVASFFPDAGIIRMAGLRFNPIIWTVLTLAVMIAFILLTKGFVKSKEMQGSDIIIHDGFSDSDTHGIKISGPKDWRTNKKQRLVYFLSATGILLIEITTNLVYFVQTQGDEAFLLALMISLIPSIILICEAIAVSHDVYKSQVERSILQNAGTESQIL